METALAGSFVLFKNWEVIEKLGTKGRLQSKYFAKSLKIKPVRTQKKKLHWLLWAILMGNN